MNRIDRLFAITLLLQSKRRVRALDLARHFDVSERTIYRDMAALSESGVPIVSLPGEGYELAEGYYLPPLLFTPSEAAALFLGAQMLVAHATGRLPADAWQALAKISVILPARLRAEVERLTDIIHFIAPTPQFDLDEPRLATLQQAIRERRLVRLRYHSHSRDEVTEREVEPYRLSYNNGAWYMEGYCRLRHDVRDFRLNRIEDLKVLTATFTPREAPRPASEPITVRVRFAPEVARWVRERQHYGFQEEEVPDSRGVVMIYRVGALAEIQPWLLGWGASAEPLSPPELREAIRQEISRLAELLT